ncbi:MAG: NfeD family protein [Treponema sp.]|jgi:membrane protein implicated in regulation of membrane protease activity|nr:NfeD family protein [Treponema sp.]
MLFDFGYVEIRWVWAVLVVVFALIEAFTLGLTTVWLALSALVMVFLSFLKILLPLQIIIFLLISAVLLFFTRPLAIKKFKTGKEKTNVDSLVGMPALVTRQIHEFERGEVKLNGQFWTARSEDGSVINEGTKCEVVRIEGVQAIVRISENSEKIN